MSFTLWIGARLPGLNDLLQAKGTVSGQWNAYNAAKARWSGDIRLLAMQKGLTMQEPGMATFLFEEPHRQRDPDNLVGGGVKLILDSLVGAEVLPGDGWSTVLGFVGYWRKSELPGCLVHWGDELQTKEAMEALLEKELENVTAKQEDGRGSGTGRDGRNYARFAQAARRKR